MSSRHSIELRAAKTVQWAELATMREFNRAAAARSDQPDKPSCCAPAIDGSLQRAVDSGIAALGKKPTKGILKRTASAAPSRTALSATAARPIPMRVEPMTIPQPRPPLPADCPLRPKGLERPSGTGTGYVYMPHVNIYRRACPTHADHAQTTARMPFVRPHTTSDAAPASFASARAASAALGSAQNAEGTPKDISSQISILWHNRPARCTISTSAAWFALTHDRMIHAALDGMPSGPIHRVAAAQTNAGLQHWPLMEFDAGTLLVRFGMDPRSADRYGAPLIDCCGLTLRYDAHTRDDVLRVIFVAQALSAMKPKPLLLTGESTLDRIDVGQHAAVDRIVWTISGKRDNGHVWNVKLWLSQSPGNKGIVVAELHSEGRQRFDMTRLADRKEFATFLHCKAHGSSFV